MAPRGHVVQGQALQATWLLGLSFQSVRVMSTLELDQLLNTWGEEEGGRGHSERGQGIIRAIAIEFLEP